MLGLSPAEVEKVRGSSMTQITQVEMMRERNLVEMMRGQNLVEMMRE